MPNTPNLEQRIKIQFNTLEKRSSVTALPSKGRLVDELNKLVEESENNKLAIINVKPQITSLFATAAVEMWLRSVHSFLISLSLTEDSSIWASVSGYYSSHYCVRGLAHLLGYFQLYRKKYSININIDGGKHYCCFNKKEREDREHKYYWKIVKNSQEFKNDPFFTFNEEKKEHSDTGHRNIANYIDHIDNFPKFRPLDKQKLENRISQLSKIELSSVPIPNINNYPDLDNVQLIALHRIIKFRTFLDDILDGKNLFWKNYRNPTWCMEFWKFQVTKPNLINFSIGAS